jgi:hypothetical protein
MSGIIEWLTLIIQVESMRCMGVVYYVVYYVTYTVSEWQDAYFEPVEPLPYISALQFHHVQ